MPIQPKIKTHHFVDEEGTMIPDSTFTVRNRISHDARNKYLAAVTGNIPDLQDMVQDGKVKEGFKPELGADAVETIEKILLQDGLVDLEGVLDKSGKEIKTWQEFLHHDDFYVTQVIQVLQENALAEIKKAEPNPNASAPSAAR